MDDEQCAVCGRSTDYGRLYCSAACQDAEASTSSSSQQHPQRQQRQQQQQQYPSPQRQPRQHGNDRLSRDRDRNPLPGLSLSTTAFPPRVRPSHSIDISASDRGESSSAASLSSLRLTSPPSSLGDDDDNLKMLHYRGGAPGAVGGLGPPHRPVIPRPNPGLGPATTRRDYEYEYDAVDAHPLAVKHPPFRPQQQLQQHLPAAPPPSAFGAGLLKLQFARRPSQTNNRSAITSLVSAHRRTQSNGGSALATTPPSLAAISPLALGRLAPHLEHVRPHGLQNANAQAVARPKLERKVVTAPTPAVPQSSTPVPVQKRSRSSLPAALARIKMSPAAVPLVTMTHVDGRAGEAASCRDTAASPVFVNDAMTPPAPAARAGAGAAAAAALAAVERSTSTATVRLAHYTRERVRPTTTTAFFRAQADDEAEADGDASETENVVEPIRGRGRTRTRFVRRDSTPGAGLGAGERPAFLARIRRVEQERSPKSGNNGRERRMSMRV